MKKIGFALLLGALCATLLAGCGTGGQGPSPIAESGGESSAAASSAVASASSAEETSSETTGSTETSSTSTAGTPAIAVRLDDHTGENIGEFPEITGVQNDAVDLINRSIGNAMQRYQQHLQNSADGSWMECRAYTVSNRKYLNIVLTEVTYPTYGTQGTATSYNYDIANGAVLSTDDAMQASNTTTHQIEAACQEYIAAHETYMEATDCNISSFVLNADGTADFQVQVFLQNTADAPQQALTTPHNGLYTYHSADQSITPYTAGTELVPGAEMT